MNDEAVYRAAPATPGLLNMKNQPTIQRTEGFIVLKFQEYFDQKSPVNMVSKVMGGSQTCTQKYIIPKCFFSSSSSCQAIAVFLSADTQYVWWGKKLKEHEEGARKRREEQGSRRGVTGRRREEDNGLQEQPEKERCG